MKKQPRLDYEYKIKEISISTYSLENFSEDQGLASLHTTNSPELEAAFKALSGAVSALLSHLTQKQRTVIELMLQGLTQTDIAARLGIGQSAVHFSLFGQKDNKSKAPAGGSIPKLKKLCANNTDIQTILKRIAQLKKEEPDEDD